MNISRTYTIEMKESRAKLMNENKSIIFNKGDVGTSIIKFLCKKEDGSIEDLTDLSANIIVETPNLDATESKIIITQGTCTIDEVAGSITFVLENSLIDTVGEYVLQLQLIGTSSEVYTYSPQINYTVKDVIG